MITYLGKLHSLFGEPVRLTHEIDLVDGRTTEDYHIFVAGINARGDGQTFSEAVSSISKKTGKEVPDLPILPIPQ